MDRPGLAPARIDWDDDGTPRSPEFGDVYRPREGTLAQARHVFLAGNGLPERWAGRNDFTIAETGFGLGGNFLATWQAWRDDPRRCSRLHHVAFESRPTTAADLARAHAGTALAEPATALIARWPPPVSGLHRIDLDQGRVRLLLVFGDIGRTLPEIPFAADAFYLDGFAPAANPAMWQPRVLAALGRRAAAGATLATWCLARAVRDGLAAAGFACDRAPGLGRRRAMLRARFAPRFPVTEPAQPDRASPVLVVGAGLAGASAARALAELGREVVVIDRQPHPAMGSSGNPAGIFHATVHADDGVYARLFRAAALYAVRRIDSLGVARSRDGLLRLEHALDWAAMRERIDRLGLPDTYVQALDAHEASHRAGVALAKPAWFYPGGGAVAPAALVAALLDHEAIRFRGGCELGILESQAGLWRLRAVAGQVIAQAAEVVLAGADATAAIWSSLGGAAPPLTRSRGQVSLFDGPTPLRRPLAGDGYALPLPTGGLLCGATRSADDDPEPRDDDHRANFDALRRLCGIEAPADPACWRGRVGWRVQSADRLPVVGAAPARQRPAGTRMDQARLVPRERGLYLAWGLGARGITLAPLAGEVIAARITGTPLPLEQPLLDAIDPARELVRQARRRDAAAAGR